MLTRVAFLDKALITNKEGRQKGVNTTASHELNHHILDSSPVTECWQCIPFKFDQKKSKRRQMKNNKIPKQSRHHRLQQLNEEY